MKQAKETALPSTGLEPNAPVVHIRLLGGFEAVRAGERIVQWPRRSARTLIKLLALTPPHRLHSQQVQEALFPDDLPEAAQRAVYRVLYAARRILEPDRGADGWAPYLRIEDEILSLHPTLVQVDADAFERAAREALRSADPGAHEAALALYTGELLPDDRYAEWSDRRRKELAELALQLMLRLARLLEERRHLAPAIEWAKRALAHDPWNEACHRQLMRLYTLAGRRHEALRHYQEWASTARAELGAEPDAPTVELYDEIVAGSMQSLSTADVEALEEGPTLPRAAGRWAGSPLVGRARALTLLAEVLDRVVTGAGALLLISGEAGVGKTRLVAELARQARDRGCGVLWGTSYMGESLLPYGPYLAALDEHAGRLPEAMRHQLALRFPELTGYVPALASHSTALQIRSPRQEVRLVGVLPRILDEIASRRPLVLILDDLHAADDDSLQLLRHLTRLATDRPWLLVGTYREGEVPPEGTLSNLMRLAIRQQLGRHLEVLRLARDESDALVSTLLGGGRVEPATLTQLYDATLGNPLFLEELVRALRDGGQLTFTHDIWRRTGDEDMPLPDGVRELVAARVEGLEPETRSVVQLAAVAGMTFPYPVLRAGSSLSGGRLMHALEAALASRLLDEADDRYRFTHPLIRLAIYEQLSSTRRTHLHRRLGESYERLRPDEVEVLAYHWEQAHDIDRAIHYAELAGDRARHAFANEVAATYYRQALRHVDQRQVEARARLSEKLSGVLVLLGRSVAAIEMAEQAARLFQSLDDVRGEARAVAQLSEAHYIGGTPEDGLTRILPVVDRLEMNGDEEIRAYTLSHLYTALSRLHFRAGRYVEQLRAAEAAQRLALEIGDRLLAARAGARRGGALILLGRREEAKGVLLEAAREAEELGDLALQANALANVAAAYEDEGDLHTAHMYEKRSAEVAERGGAPVELAWALGVIGTYHSQVGDWEQAKEHFRRQMAILNDLDASRYPAYATSALGYHLLLQGDETGLRMIEEALEVAQRGRDRQAIAFMQQHLAFYDLQEGRPEDAFMRLEPLRKARSEELDQAGFTALVWTGRAALALGRLQQAEELLDEAVPMHERGRLDDRAILWSTRALLLSRLDRWSEATTAIEKALKLVCAQQNRWAEALVRLDWGELLCARGERQAAEEHLRIAAAVFRRAGAKALLARTERLLVADSS